MDRKGGKNEMNSKILLLSIAVISVGLFAMPSTLSLFSGQHTFVEGQNVACQKCHADIFEEIGGSLNQVHTASNFTGVANLGGACQGCHRTGNITGIRYNGTINTGNLSNFSQNVTVNPNAHAAVTLECIACHAGVPAEFGSEEAHRPFYISANRTNQSVIDLKGANTACIACHTHTRVNITWIRLTSFNVTANGTTGNWTVSLAIGNATNTTYTNKSY